MITGYKIRFKKREDQRSRTVTTDGNRRLYALTNLEKNMQYQVKIAAINVNGTGPYTNKFRATTFRDDLNGNYINAVYPAIGLFFVIINGLNSVIITFFTLA